MSRQGLIRLVTFLGGLYFFLEYVLPEDMGGVKFGKYHTQISQGLSAVVAMAFGLGLINLLFIHGSKIAFLRSGWANSLALLFGLALMLTVTLLDWRSSSTIAARAKALVTLAQFAQRIADDRKAGLVSESDTANRLEILTQSMTSERATIANELAGAPLTAQMSPEDGERLRNYDKQLSASLDRVQGDFAVAAAADPNTIAALRPGIEELVQHLQDRLNLLNTYTVGQRTYKLLYDGLFTSLGSAMFALLGFYMAAAAYRAFRIRSIESALMMTAALIVMLGQIPFGLWLWDGFSSLRLWLLTTPSTAAFRAIKFGASIAGLVMAFRMWLSIESQTFGERHK
jgi:hypothetical protein